MDAIKKTWWFAGIFGIWLAYPLIISHDIVSLIFPWMSWTKRGQIGDSFGALNTLFSGLALVGLWINLNMQGEQLKKLEKKEQDNEDQLRAQVETLKESALLSYYSDEIKRLTEGIYKVHEWKPSSAADKAEKRDLLDSIQASLTEVREKRDVLVHKLSGDMAPDHTAADK